MQKLSQKQCADKLGISLATFRRRVRIGRYGKGEKVGPEHNALVWYSYADIGLQEPAEPEPCSDLLRQPANRGEVPPSSPEPEPISEEVPRTSKPEPTSLELPKTSEPTAEELRIAAELLWADKYKRGEVPDSFGNYVGIPKLSAIGPTPERQPRQPKQYGDEHMPERLRVKIDGPITHAGSDNHPMIAPRIKSGEIAPSNRAYENLTKGQLVELLIQDRLKGWSR
jgi:hypothetical protein